MPDTPAVAFPCTRLPDGDREARLLGLYPQVQEGRWMERVKVLGGVLTADQWRTLAAIARQHTPAAPLHLTTRQDIELHDLTAESVPAVQERLAQVRLTTLGAGGDSVRNITVCPCAGVAPGGVELLPLAWDIRLALEAMEGILALPRKFKISLSCGEACGQPWINDLGLVAERRDARWGFRVLVGGSLGPRPAAATPLFDWLPPGDVLACLWAVVRVFMAHGDREHRGRARLRHMRERMGEDRFTALLRGAFAEAKTLRAWPEVLLGETGGGFPARLTLAFPNGDLAPDAADALAALAARDDVRVRITNHHRVLLFGRHEQHLRSLIANAGPLADAARPQPAVVACPGIRWCARAVADTNRLADRIRTELGDRLPPESAVCISGCPNGCAHSHVADFGLIGGVRREDGKIADAYALLVGGGMGRGAKLAEPVARGLSADQVIAEIGARAPAFR